MKTQDYIQAADKAAGEGRPQDYGIIMAVLAVAKALAEVEATLRSIDETLSVPR